MKHPAGPGCRCRGISLHPGGEPVLSGHSNYRTSQNGIYQFTITTEPPGCVLRQIAKPWEKYGTKQGDFWQKIGVSACVLPNTWYSQTVSGIYHMEKHPDSSHLPRFQPDSEHTCRDWHIPVRPAAGKDPVSSFRNKLCFSLSVRCLRTSPHSQFPCKGEPHA